MQSVLILAGLTVAIVLVLTTERHAPNSFNMLAHIDKRVGIHESENDVRCWSSFNKLQMFITGSEITKEAGQARIEGHMELIHSIWSEAKNSRNGASAISEAAVDAVLQRRFPQVDTGSAIRFDLGRDEGVTVQNDAIRDYADTIEPWRLLQTWATRNLNQQGEFALLPPFSKGALEVLYRFFRSYDLAVLQRARGIALTRKLSSIDSAAIKEAFRDHVRGKTTEE